MEEKIKELLNPKLQELGVFVDSVIYEEEQNHHFLRIALDSGKTLDLDLIVQASNIINPIMDKEDLIKENYHLDIYGKSKGNDENEES